MKILVPLLLFFWASQAAGQAFVTTWNSNLADPKDDAPNQITIPTKGEGYNYSITWEQVGRPDINGSIPGPITGTYTITFPTAGIYRVSITGDFPRIYFYESINFYEILTVEQWGDIAWKSMESAFFGCHSLSIPAVDAPDLSQVTDMRQMFAHAWLFNSPIDHWDVSHVTEMGYMFWDATYYNQPLDGWDVSNVTNMDGMFKDAPNFNQPLETWNVGRVGSMFSMFDGANHFNQPLATWDLSQVSNMRAMFKGATKFNQPLGTWNVGNVSVMDMMLSNSGINTCNYDQTLVGWAAQRVKSDVSLGADGLTYCVGAPAHAQLMSTSGWKITGDIKINLPGPVVSVLQPSCVGTTGTITVTTENTGGVYSFDNGVTFQSNNTKTGLQEGVYSVLIIDSRGCPSPATAVDIDPSVDPPNPIISGSRIVCPNTTAVDYRANIDTYTYTWFVTGGVLKTQQNNAIQVDWGTTNFNASVKVVGKDPLNCSTDTITFPVKIQVQLKPEITGGMDSVCYNFREGVPYQSSYTNGSTYTWFATGGVVAEGQTTSRANINWTDLGPAQLWVKEENTTSTDYCEGLSDILNVVVFKDLAAITMNFVSVDYHDDKKVQIQWDATLLERISDLIIVSRRIAGRNDAWEIIATLEKNVQSFLDHDVPTDRNSYEYKVEGYNKCDEGLQTVIHNTIKLAGDKVEEQELIELAWNDYNGWDAVERYEIWRKLDGDTTYRLVDVTSGEITNYAGKHGGDGFVHVLRIKAKKENENTISWSNDLELDFENAIDDIPNVITPNDDSKNEYFVIPKLDLYPDNYLNVFNRWGEPVFEKWNYTNDWNAGNLPVGTYYYSLHLSRTHETLKGWVQVVR